MTEQTGEEADQEYAKLVDLAVRSLEAHERAVAGPYSPEAWAPWREAGHAFQEAVREYVAAGEGRNRFEVEMSAKAAAKARRAGS
ncbi:hypothetical protein [Streptomyces fuscigenes]|uniref:hypothetical protein n=1 Tax=Streptomyces fuscigenes TaxID=1528880 RepID=UPI001F2CC8C4|nr:hypothetical protein [Streptomyces fuscigenes]MCF3960272.1 hypothetical protein [Streptomyces fuscigenes]